MTVNMLSDVGKMVQETADRILAAHCGPAQLKAVEGGWNAELWAELAAAGLPLALEPAGRGDLELPVADALNLVRVAARHAAPAPLAETLFCNWLLRSGGLEPAAEPLTLIGLNERDHLTIERSGAGWRLRGLAHRAPWARHCGLVVAVETLDGLRIARVPAGEFEVVPGENLAREPRDQVRLDTIAPADRAAASSSSRLQLRAQAAALRALQISGAAERALELTVNYAKERVQFGRAIGKFQAVQQSIAIIGGQVAAARAAADMVASGFERADAFPVFAAAKIRAGEAAGIIARHAHQVHGAIGFTQEYELHFLTKRLWSWRDEYGNEARWSRLLGDEVFRRGADAAWPFLTSGLAGLPALSASETRL
jgi:alkylation response protein AidB-like acyl-CoA dehydrogenase